MSIPMYTFADDEGGIVVLYMYFIVLHIGIYIYWTNSNKAHKSVFVFNMQNTTKHST